MNGIWCGVRHPRRMEIHLFPFSFQAACGRRVRSVDDISFTMSSGPSAPCSCVCGECWSAYADATVCGDMI